MTASFFAVDPALVLRDEIVEMITARHNATPRHLQVELGPSDLGHPCPRRMALSLGSAPRCNPQWDPLPSIIGTATHAWLQTAAILANENLGRERWLTETKVHVTDWLSGSCDLYDIDTGTVVDYKVPGANQFAILRANMSPVYRSQVHLYGKGFVNAGYPVKTVAVMLIPRGGTLSSSHLWSEPYDEAVADEAIERRVQVGAMLEGLNVEAHPEYFEFFAKDGYQCLFCPFFAPKPDGPTQCEGDDK